VTVRDSNKSGREAITVRSCWLIKVSESREFPIRPRRDFDQLVDQEVVIGGFQDVLDYGSEAVPLFVAGQAALAEDNQTRVHLDVEKPDKIARVACNDDKVIFESVVPDFRVRLPRQTDTRRGHSEDTLITEFPDQRRRNMFVEQYANQRWAPGSLSIRKRFFGRPGGCPSRAASRA